jgi:acetyltransferase-like isoleucine patch superfamily enzyme
MVPYYNPYHRNYVAFQKYIQGQSFNLKDYFFLGKDFLTSTIEGLIRYIPGPFGMLIRRFYYRFTLAHLGSHVLIDVGVFLIGSKNISIKDYTWIDTNVRLEAMLGRIEIGSRVHIAANVIVGSRESVIIGDFAAIAAGAKIYSNSEVPLPGLHMSGPMVPEKHKSFESKPIELGKDSVVGANAVLLPGANLGEGSILGALSFLNKTVPNWEIWAGAPARRIAVRPEEPFTFN